MKLKKSSRAVVSLLLSFGLLVGPLNLATIEAASDLSLSSIEAAQVTGVTYDYKVEGDIDSITVKPVGEEPIKTPLTIDQKFSPTTTDYTTTMTQAFPASFAVNAMPADPNAEVKVQYFANEDNVDYDTVKIGIDNCWLSALPAVGDEFYATVTVTGSDKATSVTTITTTIVSENSTEPNKMDIPENGAELNNIVAPENSAELESIEASEVTGVTYDYKVVGDIDSITVKPVGEEPIKTPLTIDQEFSPTTTDYTTTMTQAFPASFAVNAMPADPNAEVKVQYFANENNVDFDTVKIGIDNCWLSALPAVGDEFYATITSTVDGKESVYTVTTTIVSPENTEIKSSSAKQVSGVTYTYEVPGDIDTVSITPVGDEPIINPLPVVPNNLEKKYSHELEALSPSSYAVDAIAMNPMAEVKVQYFADESNVDYDDVKIGIDNCWISDTPAVGDKFYAMITITSPDGESSSTYKLTALVTE